MDATPPILIIDDDTDSGELTKRRLERAGLASKFHLGPFGSLAEIAKGDYRVVILDVMMPGLQGTNLLKGLQDQGVGTRPRILLYSSLDEAALRERARTHGAHGFLTKGASRDQLVMAVRELLDEGS